MTKNKPENKSDNYVDYVFSKKPDIEWENNGTEIIIKRKNTGVINKLAQILLKKPPVSYIHMEEIGSFIWPLIDGERSVYDIGQLVSEHFGEKAEPLYERLCLYIKNLEYYGFIEKEEL